MIMYRDYKKCSHERFKNSLNKNFANNTRLDYNSFEEIVVSLFFSQAPFKKEMVRANKTIFMNTEIQKAIIVRSRIRNKFLQEKNPFRRKAYDRQRNYCVKLIREIKYFRNSWTTKKVGFTLIIKHVRIERSEFDSKDLKFSNNLVLSAVNKFKSHLSILKIRSTRT